MKAYSAGAFMPDPTLALKLRRGSTAYNNARLALFLAGFSTFSLLYCVQPLLPEFVTDFHVNAVVSSLALSLTTGALAVAIFVAGAFSQLFSRRALMFGSMGLAAILNILAGLAPNWAGLLVARAIEGFVLGGVPAVAMAYLAEEMHPRDLGTAMGLYVAGTAFGGMTGRVGMGALMEFMPWRHVMILIGALDLIAAMGFLKLLPASQHFTVERGMSLGHHGRLWLGHIRNTYLLRLIAIGFIVMSIFVGLFNYAEFYLSGPAYHLRASTISAIFLVYGFGIVASTVAGRMSDIYGRKAPLIIGVSTMLLGSIIALLHPLPAIILGIVLVTIGFFISHSVASGWVGRLAGAAKSHATSLYLVAYYSGSSLGGSVTGWFWQGMGWHGVVTFTAAIALIGIAIAVSMTDHPISKQT